MAVCSIIALYRFLTLKTYTKEDPEADVLYTWVLPNYKEDDKILGATLRQLAKHYRAKSKYIIMLAMEAHEVGSTEKALGLITKFKDSFLHIDFTSHIHA
jgi:hypothetical protein